MEIPDDIIGYLEKYIKPKRYTLLDKFCRDYYFRKRGVSIRIYRIYRPTDLCRKYTVKILDLDMSNNIEDVTNFDGLIEISKNVIHITAGHISVEKYITLRKYFPNLKSLECEVICSNNINKITDSLFGPLEGVILQIFDSMEDLDLLEVGASMGYNLILNGGSNYDFSKVILSRIIGCNFYSKSFEPGNFPNLRYLKLHCHLTEKMIEKIKKHPSIEEIIYQSDTILNFTIVKENGVLIKNKYLKEYTFYSGDFPNFESYELIKKHYDEIRLYSGKQVKPLIEYERKTKKSKKMRIILNNYIDPKLMHEVLELFDLTQYLSSSYIREYSIDYKLHKLKRIASGAVLIFLAGDKKFKVFETSN